MEGRKGKNYVLDQDAPYFAVESLYQSRYYSSKYWLSRLILYPDDEGILLRYYERLEELEELKVERKRARERRDQKLEDLRNRKRVSNAVPVPCEPRKPPKICKKQKQVAPDIPWTPTPLSWD